MGWVVFRNGATRLSLLLLYLHTSAMLRTGFHPVFICTRVRLVRYLSSSHSKSVEMYQFQIKTLLWVLRLIFRLSSIYTNSDKYQERQIIVEISADKRNNFGLRNNFFPVFKRSASSTLTIPMCFFPASKDIDMSPFLQLSSPISSLWRNSLSF